MTEAPRTNPFDTMLKAYLQWGEPVSRAFARAALDRAGLAPGSAVLDSCAGAGALAVAAAQEGHRVRGIDISAGMLGVLTERLTPFPGSAAEHMDALEMIYVDDSFDAAFSVLGVLNFGDAVPAALRGLVRVTRPGGVIGLVHWASTWGAPLFPMMAEAMTRLDDPAVAPLVPLVSDEYMGPAALDAALSQAGCVDVSTTVHEVANLLPEPEVAFDELDSMYLNHERYRALTDEQRSRLRGLFAEEVRAARGADGKGAPAVGHVTIGHLPQ
ncbi:class I SAM-dependent methyltransferase [Pseudonocardia sp. MH-G8]|uniref:class I SAM-dependent methyltransferase n=1 Tax=Pseudonocardia sp. MH-G8 TaxID=1854588 RepID=UPI00130468E2|nr:methyltransferase domain-containing protein [Pseudonocardia sp. MH-G8]